MQIVIEINDNEYMGIKEYPDNVTSYPVTIHLYDAVRDGIPLDHVFKTITDGIKEEADYSYADFDQYKADVLDAEADELPDDDFRYGMERAIEIINAYRKAVDE